MKVACLLAVLFCVLCGCSESSPSETPAPPKAVQKPLPPKQSPTPTHTPKSHTVVAAENIDGTMVLSVVLQGSYKRQGVLELGRELRKRYGTERGVQITFYSTQEAVNARNPLGSYASQGVAEELTWGSTWDRK
jgi:hypothetical protein